MFRRCLLAAVSGLLLMGCSPASVQQRPLVARITEPRPHVKLTASQIEPGRAQVTLRDATLDLTLSEQDDLVRMDIVLTNSGTRPMTLPPALFSLVDGNRFQLKSLPPHEAANRLLAHLKDAPTYSPKYVATVNSYGSTSTATIQEDGWNKLGHGISKGIVNSHNRELITAAQEVYNLGLTPDMQIGPNSRMRASVYWDNPRSKSYPLELRAPQLGLSMTFTPAIYGNQFAQSRRGMTSHDTSPFVPFDRGESPITFSLYGTRNSYKMDDVNNDIDSVNGMMGVRLLDEIGSGYGFGADITRTTSLWSLGVGIERLLAKTEVSDATAALRYNVGGWAVRGFGQYDLYRGRQMRLAIEGGLGAVITSGEAEVEITGFGSADIPVGGTGLLLQFALPVEFHMNPRFSLVSRLGYRSALVKQATSDSEDLTTLDGDPYGIDYSGVLMQVGFAIR